MKEFRVQWSKCPTAHNESKLLFVEADSPDDARKIAHDYIERKHRIEWFVIENVKETKPVPLGTVKEGEL